MQEHLNEVRFTQFKNTGFADPFGVVANDLKNALPKLKVILDGGFLDQIFHREKHLVYPPVDPAASEPNKVVGGPDSYFTATSLHYAFGNIPLDKDFIDFLTTLTGDENKLTDYFKLALRRKKRLPTIGNAVTLAEELYDRVKSGKEIPDLNLDADRGYAYTCWTQKNGNGPNPPEQPEELLQHAQQKNGLPVTPVKLDFT
jgi:hypothetical protein